jgi:hypothetical protein
MRVAWRASIACGGLVALASCGARTYDQTYLRNGDNWEFRRRYAHADRLFNAFDYGHAILSETLIRDPAGAARELEGPLYRRLTCDVLRHPPAIPLEERAIGPRYSVELPEVVATFAWAHMLHRQIYDVLAAEAFSSDERDARVSAALRYYRSRPDLALSETPKSMALMEGQPYSLAFRRAAPKFNGLIWSYHWLQMALYEALMTAPDPPTRAASVARDVEQFMHMTTGQGRYAPKVMPMSAAVAPMFSETYPDAAIIFDNLHSLHDVVSDVLASPTLARGQKRAAILQALARYRDATSYTTTLDEWRTMARGMGAVDTVAVEASAPECRR